MNNKESFAKRIPDFNNDEIGDSLDCEVTYKVILLLHGFRDNRNQ